MTEFDRKQLREWAVRGAEQRLLEIANEAAAIHRAFPELRQRGRRAGATEGGAAVRPARGRRRSKMSAANRKAVSERMKKYWAARRGGAAKSDAGAAKRAGRGRRKISAAGRKRISDAQKKRWAAKKKGATG
jgi:hypothetical protein